MSGGAMWAEIAQMMHNATMDYAKLGIGLWNDRQSRRMSREALRHQMAYDKNRISWAVADAKRAGLHPLAALGIPAGSSSVMSVGMPSSPRPDGILNHDFSKFSKMAQEAAALANEQTRLQNAKLREQIASEKAKTQQIKTSVARKDGVKNALTGFDSQITKTFSFSPQSDGTISIQPGKDINVDDLGAFFSYPEFYAGKWLFNNSYSSPIVEYANKKFPLSGDSRWVIDWSPARGVFLKKHSLSGYGRVMGTIDSKLREYTGYHKAVERFDQGKNKIKSFFFGTR